MEFTMQLIDATLFFLIYGFSGLFFVIFILEMQDAWIAHTNPSTTSEGKIEVKVEPHKVDTTYLRDNVIIKRRKPILVKENIAVSRASKSKSKIKQLREQCEKVGVEWRYARINNTTNRKRHLTEREMQRALALITTASDRTPQSSNTK